MSNRRKSTNGAAILLAILFGCAPFFLSSNAFALSEIQREEAPPPAPEAPEKADPFPGNAVPIPGPVQMPNDGREVDPESSAPQGGDEPGEISQPDAESESALPEIVYDLMRLPEPVRRMHGLIVAACKSGDIERLRPLIESGENGTQLSFGGPQSDPIAFLKELSGDEQGHEILAILQEVLSAGFVHVDAGTESELYVWPYFFAVPLDRLTAPQRVELFTIVTAGDYEDMKAYGAYIFYRAGITPEGRWAFFVAGD